MPIRIAITSIRHAAFCAAFAVACGGLPALSVAADPVAADPTPVFRTLHVFDAGAEGSGPRGLIQASDGNLYGVTRTAGPFRRGTLFRMIRDHDRAVEVLHEFGAFADDGQFPYGTLVEASDGNFYGTTTAGGTAGYGTIYRYAPDGTYTILYSFGNIPDGQQPFAGLIQASDGRLYGTAFNGGTGLDGGTVFRMSLDGSDFSVLHHFQVDDGYLPAAELVEAQDGLLYGTTTSGGARRKGAAFSVSTDGVFTLLHSFTDADGTDPRAPLFQVSNGQFFGTTLVDGPNGAGTVFRMTPKGKVTVVHAFGAFVGDGMYPASGLLDPGDGYLYGTTLLGGRGPRCTPGDCGVVYRIARDGTETILHAFTSTGTGARPDTGLIRIDHRGLVGTSQGDGGTIFGLRETLP